MIVVLPVLTRFLPLPAQTIRSVLHCNSAHTASITCCCHPFYFALNTPNLPATVALNLMTLSVSFLVLTPAALCTLSDKFDDSHHNIAYQVLDKSSPVDM